MGVIGYIFQGHLKPPIANLKILNRAGGGTYFTKKKGEKGLRT